MSPRYGHVILVTLRYMEGCTIRTVVRSCSDQNQIFSHCSVTIFSYPWCCAHKHSAHGAPLLIRVPVKSFSCQENVIHEGSLNTTVAPSLQKKIGEGPTVHRLTFHPLPLSPCNAFKWYTLKIRMSLSQYFKI